MKSTEYREIFRIHTIFMLKTIFKKDWQSKNVLILSSTLHW